jgi:DNA end-binding protein Ku
MQVLKQSLAEGRPPGQDARSNTEESQPNKRANKPAPKRSKAKKRPTDQHGKGKQAAGEGKRRSAELESLSRVELYERAQQLDLPGRSRMSKAELARAIAAAG